MPSKTLFCVLVIVAAGSARAELTVTYSIDPFDVDHPILTVNDGTVQSTVFDLSLPGGSRNIRLQSTPAGFTDTAAGVSTGLLFLSTPPALPLSVTTISYPGLDSLSPLDLTVNGGKSFYFEILTQDHDANWTIRVDDGTTAASSTLGQAAIGSPTDLLIDFTDFGGVDFTKIEALEFEVAAVQPDLDYTLAQFGVVPEPSTAMVLLAGLSCGLLRRRRLGSPAPH